MLKHHFSNIGILRLAVLSLGLLWVAAPSSAHEYVVEVDNSARLLKVRATFDEPVKVALGSRRAARYVRQLRRCDSDESLRLRRGRVQTSERCLQYSVTLNKSANDSRTRERYANVRDIVTNPDNWLMLPNDEDTLIRVAFVLPKGVNVSVPWQPLEDVAFAQPVLAALKNSSTTRLEGYAFRHREISSNAITAFGRFQRINIPVSGGELRVALLRTKHKTAADKLKHWLSDAAYNVSQAHGKFPMRSTQVVVVPVNDRAAEPVPFGHVIRNGGEAVQFFVDTDWSVDSFLSDWTATHEFSHLLMPYVGDRWVSEGFASYYQNVLMARGEVYSPSKAWRKLYEGYGRGRMSAPGMSPRSASMRNGGLMKVYWSGAAIALMGDVQLRELSDNAESLDTAMRKVRLCCLPSRKAYRDIEFLELLDSKTNYTVFTDLYRDYANSAGFPDVRELFRRMGIRTGGEVTLVNAELAHIRDAIMQPRPIARTSSSSFAAPGNDAD